MTVRVPQDHRWIQWLQKLSWMTPDCPANDPSVNANICLQDMSFKYLITIPTRDSDPLAISGSKSSPITWDFKCLVECHVGAEVALYCFWQWHPQCRQMCTKKGSSSSRGRVRRNIFRQPEFNSEFRNPEYPKNTPIWIWQSDRLASNGREWKR